MFLHTGEDDFTRQRTFDDGSARFLRQWSDCEYFQGCTPYGLFLDYATLPLQRAIRVGNSEMGGRGSVPPRFRLVTGFDPRAGVG